MGFFPGRSFTRPTSWSGGRPIRGPFSNLAGLQITRRLWRTVQSGRFEVSIDRDFAQVIHACATAGDRRGNTWITPALLAAYCRLHDLGHAHSVEVWQDGRLVGGTYGVALRGLFAGESMFHRERDASKVALVHLMHHLGQRGYQLFDIQQLTPHTESLGAIEISRQEYLRRLAQSQAAEITFGASWRRCRQREEIGRCAPARSASSSMPGP